MNITDVKIKGVRKSGKMRGTASITIDNAFVIHDIRIINSKQGVLIAMPNRKDQVSGRHTDIAHPLNESTRQVMQKAIVDKYNVIMQKIAKNNPLDDLILDDGVAR